MDKGISLAEGSGGKEMSDLIKQFGFNYRGDWKNYDNDASTLDLGNGNVLVFTTDSFTVSPVFFPGGNIGELAFNGAVNDLLMMGAEPLGISFGFVIEEGFNHLKKITESIKKISETSRIPVATGDTKVMEKGKIDQIIINASVVGICKKEDVLDKKIEPGDQIIISGSIGEHAVALLSKRFDFETGINTDSKLLKEEMISVKSHLKQARDPTRGGIASTLNEFAEKYRLNLNLDEEKIPLNQEVRKAAEMLGLDVYQLACEGRMICFCNKEDSNTVLEKLKSFNASASIIGEVSGRDENGIVIINTKLGKRILRFPTGRIVPRIC